MTIPEPKYPYNYMIYPEIVRVIDPKKRFRLTLNEVLFKVCEYMEHDIATLRKRDRKRDFVTTRQLYYYFAKKYTSKPLQSIGRLLGYDHATVLYGIRHMEDLRQTDKDIQLYMGEIEQIFNSYI